jgi:hypothetical protein
MRNLIARLWAALARDPYGDGDATAELIVQRMALEAREAELKQQVRAELARRENLS